MKRTAPIAIVLFLVVSTVGVCILIATHAFELGFSRAPSENSAPSERVVETSTASSNAASVATQTQSATLPGSGTAERAPDLPTGLGVRVFDDTGHPVSGASIWVIPVQRYDFPPMREIDSINLCEKLADERGVSDATGQYSWTTPSDARRVIVARAIGHQTGYAWSEEGSRMSRTLSIVLRRGGGLRGIVYDGEKKHPVADAFVSTVPRAHPGFEGDQFAVFARFLIGAATRTGADGRFEFNALCGETSELSCTSPANSQIHVDWIVPSGQEITLAFVGNVPVNGNVSDELGAPIEGANICVATAGVLPITATEAVHSDRNGDFLCEMVPVGLVEVKVDKMGFGVFKQPFMVKDGSESFNITLRPEVEFAGTVVDMKNKPIQGASVRVVDAKQFVMCGQMDSLEDGSWFMYWVPAGGPIDVFVTKDGFVPTRLRGIDAPQGKLRIQLTPACGLEGRVVDPEGQPLTQFAFRSATRCGSQVQEYQDRIEDPWHSVTSPDGHFGFRGGLPGLTEVSVRCAGYRPKTISDISIGPGESVGPVEFRLEHSPSVQGRVVDSRQSPIVGASVEIAERTFDGRATLTRDLFGTTTGPGGEFLLDTVPSGTITLVVRRGENRTVFSDLHAEEFPRTFVIEEEGSIVGSVAGSWVRPETCVRIRVSQNRTWIGREVRPDADGRFQVSNLSPGDYQIELIDDWSEQERMRDGRVTSFATIHPGETTTVFLDATGTGVIDGRVVTKGSRLGGQQLAIRAFSADKIGIPVAECSVDEAGVFRFDHLHAGSYRIRVGAYERGTALAVDREVTVADNAIVGPIEFVIGGGGLSGRVLRDDGSPADARVYLLDSPGGQEVAAVRTDADGTYRILSAPDGEYVVLASSAAFADGYTGPVRFPGAPDAPMLEQRLVKESRLLARVRDDLGGAIGGAAVAIDVATRPMPLRNQSLESNGLGQAEFTRLPAGSLTVSASHAGYVPADPIVVGLAPDQRRTVDLMLARCGSLDVVVKDARGQALAGVEVTVMLIDSDPRSDATTRHAKSNVRGATRFSSLRPGRWQVSGELTNQVTVEIEPGATAAAELAGQH